MVVEMKVEIELTGVREAMKVLDPKLVTAASRSAVKKVSDQCRTHISKMIRDEYNIKAKDINKRLKVATRARGDELEAEITGLGRGLPLSAFDARQEGVRTRKGETQYTKKAQRVGWGKAGGVVSVLVKHASGRKPVRTEPKAFLTRFKSGHLAVAQRTGSNRLPIKELLGPGIALLFGSKRIMAAAKDFSKLKFREIFERELKWRSR